MNYETLFNNIQSYAQSNETTFVSNIPFFVEQAETRIYNNVQIPSLRKNVTGAFAYGNQYLSLPFDWLETYSISVIDSSGNYNYLLNKDVNFIREAYPNNGSTSYALPKYYAIFGSAYSNVNELTAIVGPTPDQSYNVELHYFYYPVSIVQGVLATLSTASLTSGTLYTPGTYTDVALTGGSGSGATADIIVNSSGYVSSVTLQNGGSFYQVGDTLSAATSSIGGTGSGFSITVTSVNNPSGQSWLGDNYDPVLFYGAMREAAIFQRQEQDVVAYYEKMYQEALAEMKRLGDGLERGDAYRDGQTKLLVKT
jgi:hypothetical protein